MVSISCGKSHLMAPTELGRVYGWRTISDEDVSDEDVCCID